MRLIFSKANESLSSVAARLSIGLPACHRVGNSESIPIGLPRYFRAPSKERFVETAWSPELCGSGTAQRARLQLQLGPRIPSRVLRQGSLHRGPRPDRRFRGRGQIASVRSRCRFRWNLLPEIAPRSVPGGYGAHSGSEG